MQNQKKKVAVFPLFPYTGRIPLPKEVGNDGHAQVEAIGSYDLVLPNGLVICLDNYHYAPSITRGVVSVHLCFKRAKHNLDFTCLWHRRLAHTSKKHIEKLQQEGLLRSIDDELFDQCVSCLSGKMTRKSFLRHLERAINLFRIIHTDVCGLLRHVSRQGASYFITFMDDYSRYGYVYLLKHKHEVFETFKDYALVSATRILNMVPTKKVDKTPYELWYGKVLNLSYLKVWGCEALVKRDTPDKLQQRSVKCIFIGYPKETIGYYFYFPPENKIVVARYAELFEKNLITQKVSGRVVDLEEI
uniref:Uncharacterized protein n=1 Tax=Tanacetum cinerariifolium TaxID=118510 RepID=A0A6L2NBQ5_TANCI|nr:hypothetical protein [Tanacetum cinerariifolium]